MSIQLALLRKRSGLWALGVETIDIQLSRHDGSGHPAANEQAHMASIKESRNNAHMQLVMTELGKSATTPNKNLGVCSFGERPTARCLDPQLG